MADFKLNYTGTQINTILGNVNTWINSNGIVNNATIGPLLKLPSGETTLSLLTSGGAAINLKSGRLGLGDSYAALDLINYRFHCNGGLARFDGTVNIYPGATSGWTEGLRIHSSTAGWTTLILCGTDNTGDSGTSANSWSLHTLSGDFYIAKNGSSSSSAAILSCVNNSWSFNGIVTIPAETGTVFLRVPWWTSGNGNNANNLRHGCTFAYTNHNCPTNGTLAAFDCSTNTGYTLQIQGNYGGGGLYYRNCNGDKGTWGSWYSISSSAVSSIKTKTNIKNLTDSEAKKILSLRPISFDYKKEYGKKNQYGFIAEEVNNILPYMISNYQWDNTKETTNELLQLDFYRIIPHIVKMIQIQNQEIENLKSRINSLENK